MRSAFLWKVGCRSAAEEELADTGAFNTQVTGSTSSLSMPSTAAEYSTAPPDSVYFRDRSDERSIPLYLVSIGEVRMKVLYCRPQFGNRNQAVDTSELNCCLLRAPPSMLEKTANMTAAVRGDVARTFIGVSFSSSKTADTDAEVASAQSDRIQAYPLRRLLRWPQAGEMESTFTSFTQTL
jgi:hypothetical protein